MFCTQEDSSRTPMRVDETGFAFKPMTSWFAVIKYPLSVMSEDQGEVTVWWIRAIISR